MNQISLKRFLEHLIFEHTLQKNFENGVAWRSKHLILKHLLHTPQA
jgi:hypothetical protein